MAATAKVNLLSQCACFSENVTDSNGDVTMKQLVASLKIIRQNTEQVLNNFIQKEKERAKSTTANSPVSTSSDQIGKNTLAF